MADSDITNDQIEALRRRISGLENQKRMPMPTPEVGRWVWFFKQADLDSVPQAALVTAQESPGQVTLEIHPALSQTHINVKGVHWKDHPFLESNPQVAKMKNSGVWDFKEGDKPTEAHKELHRKQLDMQIRSANEELLRAREDEIRRRDRNALADPPQKAEKPAKAPVTAAS